MKLMKGQLGGWSHSSQNPLKEIEATILRINLFSRTKWAFALFEKIN